MWTGVFFTEDTVVEAAPVELTELDRLRAENERLRAELEQHH